MVVRLYMSVHMISWVIFVYYFVRYLFHLICDYKRIGGNEWRSILIFFSVRFIGEATPIYSDIDGSHNVSLE